MDYPLHRPQSVCSISGRPFAADEEFFSALIRATDGLSRLDVSAAAWGGPPEGTIAWWKSRHLSPGTAGPALAPVDVLLDALEALEAHPDDAPLRYLLALQLVRRRALRMDGSAGEEPDDDGMVVFSCRRRDRDYRVREVSPAAMADPAVAARLTALLWSGEAA